MSEIIRQLLGGEVWRHDVNGERPLADDLVFLDNGRVTLSGARTHLEGELAAFFDAGRLALAP